MYVFIYTICRFIIVSNGLVRHHMSKPIFFMGEGGGGWSVEGGGLYEQFFFIEFNE